MRNTKTERERSETEAEQLLEKQVLGKDINHPQASATILPQFLPGGDSFLGPRDGYTGFRGEHQSWAAGRQWGAGWLLSGGVGGGVDALSSLNTPAILPKKPFFFLGS